MKIDHTPLQNYLREWVRRQPHGWHLRSADDIANEWINEIAFADIAVARWLQKPETEVIMLMVRGVLPYPTDQAVTVLTEAVQIAARRRTMRQVALTAVGGVALAGLVYLMIQN